MRAALLVLGCVLVSGQRFQQSRQIVSPAVLLASNVRNQQQEQLFQDSQNSNTEFQTQFDSGSSISIQDNFGTAQNFGNTDSGLPVFSAGVENQASQARVTLASSQTQDDRSQQTNQENQFINQEQLLRPSQDSFPIDGVFEPLNLPSGAYLLMGQIDTSFTCADRPYGYYADEGNDCRVFHVCNPYLFDDGRVETLQYSFMCNEYTVFDQKELTCVEQSAAIPCQESSFHYSRNEEFGLPEEKL